MKYELFVDKQEIFECDIKLEGASISNAKARLVLETEQVNLIFMGEIDNKGNCSVPIKKLKNILPENTSGQMTLEVIADDTYFEPWKSDFFVKASKSVTVEVKQSSKKEVKKAIVEVKVEKQKSTEPYDELIDTMSKYLKEIGVSTKNFVKNKKIVGPIINEYFKKTGLDDKKKFLRDILKKL